MCFKKGKTILEILKKGLGDDITKENIFKICKKKVEDMIRDYELPITINWYLNPNKPIRVIHLIVCYYIGLEISLFTDIKSKIDKKYEKNNGVKAYFKKEEKGQGSIFESIWFLTSLMHDYGYFCSYNYASLDDLDILELGHNIFDECKSKQVFRFKKKTYYNYYKNKYESNNKNELSKYIHDEIGDHGILAGMIIYDNVVSKNEPKSIKLTGNECLMVKFKLQNELKEEEKRIIYNGIESCFFEICKAIIEHNIWNDGNFEIKFGEEYKKISSDNPLDYLLSIADTIESTKKCFLNIDCLMSVLESIRIYSNDKIIRVTINQKSCRAITKKLENDIFCLENWVDVKIKKCCKSIIIKKK